MARPRSFDQADVLHRAMRVFWEKGYEGASLKDLTRAMGINGPSIYGAFGNKRSLFEQALECYGNGPARYVAEAMGKPTAREVVERLLRGACDSLTDPANPPGCMTLRAGLANSADAEETDVLLSRARRGTLQALTDRLERASGEGDLAPDVNPASLARQVMTVAHGLTPQAIDGATREEVHNIVDQMLAAWFPNPHRMRDGLNNP
jgi:AcrR family transcriptional regulator